jgi:hypothetical protein
MAAIINRGAAQLRSLDDGRKRALAALAYQVGGLLTWSALDEADVLVRLTDAGRAAGLTYLQSSADRFTEPCKRRPQAC